MTIPFDGAGGLFTRIGHQGGWLNLINDNRGDDWAAEADNIYQDFSTYPDSALVNGLLGAYNQSILAQNQTATYLQGLAQNTLIQMVYDDTHLNSTTLGPNMTELIAQMVANSESVLRPTITISTSAGGSNVGTGVMKSSVIGKTGVQQDYVYNETIRAVVTTDAYAGTATAYREQAALSGELAETNFLLPNWPVGSGGTVNLNCTDSAQDASATGNMLVNSDFTTATVANTPNNWPINVGSAGVSVFVDGTGLRSANALRFLGDASELTSVVQQFGTSSGTTLTLKPNTVYSVGFWTKVSSVPAAGVLQVSLVNGTGASPTIVTNDASTNLATTVTLSGETTAYAFHQAFFQTPKTLPATTAVRVRLSTALDNAKSVYVSDLGFTPAVQLYPGGPYFAWHNGATQATIGDLYTTAAANNYGSAWQLLAQRLFNMTALGLQLPSVAAGETILDSLIS